MSLSDVGINLREGSFESDIGIVKTHPSKGLHWVAYIKQNYFNSYGCSPPQKPSVFIIERVGLCSYSEYKIQGLDFDYQKRAN